MTNRQVIYTCKLVAAGNSPAAVKLHLFLMITGLKVFKNPYGGDSDTTLYIGKDHWTVSADQMTFVLQTLDWLFNVSEDEKSSIKPGPVRNPLPEISSYTGPADGLANITYGEFMRCEQIYSEMSADASKISAMISCLWRRRSPGLTPHSHNYNGDLRTPYNDHLYDRNVKRFSSVSEGEKLAALMFYLGSKLHLSKLYPDAFSSQGSTEVSKKKTVPLLDHLKVVTTLAGDDITKTEAIMKKNLYEVLSLMQKLRDQAKAVQEEYDKIKRKNKTKR